MARPGNSANRLTLQWAFLAILAVVAIVYFVLPARAQERPAWSAELWATEEGEQLVAAVNSTVPTGEAFVPGIAIFCGDDLYIRYDPGPGIDDSIDWLGKTASFTFDFGTQTIERDLVYEAMDGLFAGPASSTDPLISAIKAGAEVTVRLPAGGAPDNTFSLKGATAAIAEVRRAC